MSPTEHPDWLDLDGDERVLVRARPSSNIVLASLIVGLILMFTMAVVVSFVTTHRTGRLLSLGVLLGIVGLLVLAFLVTRRREYVLTSHRVCSAVGFLEKEVTSVPVGRVCDVTVQQSWWQQLFQVGTLHFALDGGDGVSFQLVEDPSTLQQRVLQFVDLGSIDPGSG